MSIIIDLPASAHDGPAAIVDKQPKRQLLTRIGETDDYVMTIDNSSLERFITCSRSAEYYLVRGREASRSNIAQRFGGAVHKALETTYVYGQGEAVRQKEREVLLTEFQTIAVPPDDHRTPDRALSVMEKYHKQYPFELFEVATDQQGNPMVEIPFAEELGVVDMNCTLKMWEGPQSHDVQVNRIYVVWTGRIDLVLRWDSKIWVMDHKTTQMMGEGFWGEFELSQPTVGYCWAAQKIIGEPVVGLVLNALAIRKPTPTGKPTQFERRRFIYPQWQLEEWQPNTLAIVANFLADFRRGFFPQETKWCFGKYGKCQYHEICTSRPDQRESVLYSPDYRDTTWSPLNER